MSEPNGKSRDKSRDPFNGAPLIPGNPGNRGGGRPSNEFRDKLRRIIESPKVQKAFLAVITNPKHPQFATLYTKALAYAHGQPTQTVEHTGGIDLNVRELSESFESRMGRLATRLGAPPIPGRFN